MASKAKITESTFKAIKMLLKGGATYKEVQEFMGISESTVAYISTSETFEEYKHKIYCSSSHYRKMVKAKEEAARKAEQEKAEREKAEKAKQVAKDVGAVPAKELVKQDPVQVVEHRQTVQIQATHYMMEELKQMNEHLKLISNKLAFIVDELTGTGVKKDA